MSVSNFVRHAFPVCKRKYKWQLIQPYAKSYILHIYSVLQTTCRCLYVVSFVYYKHIHGTRWEKRIVCLPMKPNVTKVHNTRILHPKQNVSKQIALFRRNPVAKQTPQFTRASKTPPNYGSNIAPNIIHTSGSSHWTFLILALVGSRFRFLPINSSSSWRAVSTILLIQSPVLIIHTDQLYVENPFAAQINLPINLVLWKNICMVVVFCSMVPQSFTLLHRKCENGSLSRTRLVLSIPYWCGWREADEYCTNCQVKRRVQGPHARFESGVG